MVYSAKRHDGNAASKISQFSYFAVHILPVPIQRYKCQKVTIHSNETITRTHASSLWMYVSLWVFDSSVDLLEKHRYKRWNNIPNTRKKRNNKCKKKNDTRYHTPIYPNAEYSRMLVSLQQMHFLDVETREVKNNRDTNEIDNITKKKL